MWQTLVRNPEAIETLYVKVPELANVRVTGITLKQDGPVIEVVLVMPVYPDFPPRRWGNCNSCLLRIDFWGTSDLLINGWTTENVYDVEICKSEGGLRVLFLGEKKVSFKAQEALIQRFTAYIHDEVK